MISIITTAVMVEIIKRFSRNRFKWEYSRASLAQYTQSSLILGKAVCIDSSRNIVSQCLKIRRGLKFWVWPVNHSSGLTVCVKCVNFWLDVWVWWRYDWSVIQNYFFDNICVSRFSFLSSLEGRKLYFLVEN